MWAASASGSPSAFGAVLAATAIWLVWGYLAAWSEAWSGIAGAVTGVVSILMLVLLQGAQAADTKAIRAQIAELVRAVPEADNALIEPEIT